jgi:hypothetical protein
MMPCFDLRCQIGKSSLCGAADPFNVSHSWRWNIPSQRLEVSGEREWWERLQLKLPEQSDYYLHVAPPKFVSRKKHIIESYLRWSVWFQIQGFVPSTQLICPFHAFTVLHPALWFECVRFLLILFAIGHVMFVLVCSHGGLLTSACFDLFPLIQHYSIYQPNAILCTSRKSSCLVLYVS